MARVRSFTLTLDAETNASLMSYMNDNGLTKPEAARELIVSALASTPELAHLVSAKNKAYFETKRFILTRLVDFFQEMHREVNQSIQELDRVG